MNWNQPTDDSVYVYEYFPDTDKTKKLVDVLLWEEASSISIHNDSLYLTLEESIVVTDPYWCSYYGKVRNKLLIRVITKYQLR